MDRAFVTRLPFRMAVALTATALADPLVESVSNTGVFGGGYSDTNHLGVVPTLCLGFLLVLEMLVLRFVEVWRGLLERSRPSAFVDAARGLATPSLVRDLPHVLVLQLTALFVLESAEQLAAGGKMLWGTAWLGGPPVFSLITHALAGAGCTFALGALMRSIARAFVSIVRSAICFIWLTFAGDGGVEFDLGRLDRFVRRAQAPHARQIGGRAPPLLPTSA